MSDNGNGSISAWARAIAMVGIPGVIAIFLVYVGATEIPRIRMMVEENRKYTEFNRELLREHVAQNDELVRIVRWICVGVSKDDHDRRQCFQK
jgi:hypothetical protein